MAKIVREIYCKFPNKCSRSYARHEYEAFILYPIYKAKSLQFCIILCFRGCYDEILTYYHTMPHFDALKIYSCGKHCKKRRNCLLQAISPFQTMFSTLSMVLIFHFKCTLKCCLLFVSIWTSL